MQISATRIATLFLAASFAAFSAACNGEGKSSGSSSDSTVAASVNGKNITLTEVERIIKQQMAGKESQMSTLELGAARLQVLENLIQQEVMFQRAEKEKLLPSEDEITAAINSQKTRLTQEDWDKFLKESSQTEQGLREEARKVLATQKLQEKTVGKAGSVSNSEIESFYSNNKAQFVKSRGVAIAGIVVDPQDNGFQDDAKNDVEATAKINRLHTQLKSGADFATVARASSEDQSNVRGGDMGFATEDDLKRTGFPANVVSELFNTMQIGSFTSPVQFGGRAYIFKLSNRQLQTENLTIDSPGVRDQIRDALVRQRQQLLNVALMSTSLNDAKIVNNLAQSLLNDPNSMSALRPASATSSPVLVASPASATAAASPAATPASSPAASSSPQQGK